MRACLIPFSSNGKDMRDTKDTMKPFVEPESVAIIGATRKNGPGTYNLVENMLQFGYQGRVFPVNPQADEILGLRTFPRIGDIGQAIDLAVINLPRDLVLKGIRECAAVGVKAVIVVGQGFADADEKGKGLQEEMVAIARENGMRILGPNTLGILNAFRPFTTSFMPLSREKAPVGVICQSGIFFVGSGKFSGMMGKGIDIGNACDIGFVEALSYLGDDPDVRVIAIHMEGLMRGREFVSLASRITRKKPVVIFKTGQSEAGARAAVSHSGSMAGRYQIYKAALTQAGCTLITEDSQMRDAVRALLHLPPMRGNRIAVITVTGAGGIMATDALERYGLALAPLSPETLDPVARLSPPWMPLGNPLDLWPAVMKHGMQKVYPPALKALLADPAVDGVLCINVALRLPDYAFLDVSEELNQVVSGDKPVVAWLYGENSEGIGEEIEKEGKIIPFQTIEGAVWALSVLRQRQAYLERISGR